MTFPIKIAAGLFSIGLLGATYSYGASINGRYIIDLYASGAQGQLSTDISYRDGGDEAEDILSSPPEHNFCRYDDKQVLCRTSFLKLKADYKEAPELGDAFIGALSLSLVGAPRVVSAEPVFCRRGINKRVVFHCEQVVKANPVDHLAPLAYRIGRLQKLESCVDESQSEDGEISPLQATLRYKTSEGFVFFASFAPSSNDRSYNFTCADLERVPLNTAILHVYNQGAFTATTVAVTTLEGERVQFIRNAQR